MSGLTIGLLSLDPLHLQVIISANQQPLADRAKRVQQVVKHHHLLLCTLLIANAAAMEALPLVLDELLSPVAALAVSVSAVLIFSEIVPQAACSRYGLAIGAFCVPLVRVLMVLLFPIAYPIAKLLDYAVGTSHGTFFRRTELKELLALHAAPPHMQPRHLVDASNGDEDITASLLAPAGDQASDTAVSVMPPAASASAAAAAADPAAAPLATGTLALDEVAMLRGALEMKSTTVESKMTPLESCLFLDSATLLTAKVLRRLVESGFSRVPILEEGGSGVRGVLLVKSLVGLDLRVAEEEGLTVADVGLSPPSFLDSATSLYDALNSFQSLKVHLAVVTAGPGGRRVGIITLEDVIESLINEEIFDETDAYRAPLRSLRVARAFFSSSVSRSVTPAPGQPSERAAAAAAERRKKKASLPRLARQTSAGWGPSRTRARGVGGLNSPLLTGRGGVAVWSARDGSGSGDGSDLEDGDGDYPPRRAASSPTLAAAAPPALSFRDSNS